MEDIENVSSDDLIKQAIPLYKETSDSHPFDLVRVQKFVAILKELEKRGQSDQLKEAVEFTYKAKGGDVASEVEKLRKKIAKLGQLKFGYVDWEDETADAIRHWYKCADMILQAFHDAGGVMLADGTGLPAPSMSHTDEFLLGYQTGQGVMVNGGYRLVKPLFEEE